jgi:2-aminoadipate transaminase
MRLNFSGVSEELIRDGVRRLGEVVREQVALYGTLTGASPAGRPAHWAPPRVQSPSSAAEPAAAPAEELANVLRLPRKRA